MTPVRIDTAIRRLIFTYGLVYVTLGVVAAGGTIASAILNKHVAATIFLYAGLFSAGTISALTGELMLSKPSINSAHVRVPGLLSYAFLAIGGIFLAS